MRKSPRSNGVASYIERDRSSGLLLPLLLKELLAEFGTERRKKARGLATGSILIRKIEKEFAWLAPSIRNRDRTGVPEAGSPLWVVDATG